MKTYPILVAAMLACLASAGRAPAKQEPTPAQLRVVTHPKAATVILDGQPRAPSPTTMADVEPGQHLLIVSKQGYLDARRSVTLSEGQRALVEIKLEPVLGLVIVHSEPAGADVQVDGADRGQTPLLLMDLPVGDYRLRLARSGHVPKEVDLHVPDRTPQRVQVTLSSDTAMLVLTTDPPGAAVLINGVNRGVTPCEVDKIPEGQTELELRLENYASYRQTLKLRAGDRHELDISLTAVPGELRIVSIPPNARIYIDNQFRGEAPLKLDGLAPGEYRVRAELEHHDPLARTVVVEKARKSVEEFRLVTRAGLIQVTTVPAGVEVYIDGKKVGVTSSKDTGGMASEPLQVGLLSVGKHQVNLSRKGYYTQTFAIEVQENTPLPLHRRLKRHFIADVEVRTRDAVHRGVLVEVDPKGNVKIETRPGVFVTIPAAEIVTRITITAKTNGR